MYRTHDSTVQYGEFENGEFHKGWSRPALPRWLGAMKRGTRTARCLRGKSAAQCCSVCEACMSFNLGLGDSFPHICTRTNKTASALYVAPGRPAAENASSLTLTRTPIKQTWHDPNLGVPTATQSHLANRTPPMDSYCPSASHHQKSCFPCLS